MFKRKPQIRLNDTLRLKADSRALTKVICALYKLDPSKAAKLADKIARRAKFFPLQEKTQARSRIFSKQTQYKLTKTAWNPQQESNYFKEKSRMRPIIAHEITHVLEVSKQHGVTANAIQAYFERLKNNPPITIELPRTPKDRNFIEILSKEFGNNRTPNLFVGAFEHGKAGEETMATAGNRLGRIAYGIEKALQIQGIGAVFLREVSNGKSFDKAFNELLTETYNTQATKWLTDFKKASPRLFRYYYGQQTKK